MGNIYGFDIMLDESLQAVVAANGETAITEGPMAAVQDIRMRLATPLGSLFYDKAFGSEIYLYAKDENTVTNRMALVNEIVYRIGLDPRIVPMSAQARVSGWDHTGIVIQAEARLIDQNHKFNLVIEIGANMEMVIKDVTG